MIIGSTTELIERPCPRCGMPCNFATAIGDAVAQPEPGTLLVCFECALVSQFDENLMMQPVSRAQLAALDAPTIQALARVVLTIRNRTPGG